MGDWFYPDNVKVVRGRNAIGSHALIRRGNAQEVQLYRQLGVKYVRLFGNFICRVPDPNGIAFSTTIFLCELNVTINVLYS